jgi:uncharacterized membrane protein YkoI
MHRNTLVSSFVLAAAALALPSDFAEGRTMTIDAPTHVELTMAQAVVIAESMGNGRATRVKREERGAKPVYRVTVKSPGETPLRIDVAAADGRIVASERKDD